MSFSYFLSFEVRLFTSASNARLGQQQFFLCENQHLAPSPLSLSRILKHPSGHELPMKQNGAIPYHLQTASIDLGARLPIKRNTNNAWRNNTDAIRTTKTSTFLCILFSEIVLIYPSFNTLSFFLSRDEE